MFRAFSVFSVQKRLARWVGFTTEHTENIQKAWGSDFSVFSVPRSGFSVFSVQKRLAWWAGFTTEHTERAAPDTEHTEDFRKAWGSDFSVFSVPPEAASVCSVVEKEAA